MKGNRAQKLVFCEHPSRIAEIKAHLTDRFKNHAQVIETEPGYLEFMPLATSKFTGLQALMSKLDFHTDQALAFGDNWNDVEILSGVGFGVAMTVSSEAAKKAAKAVSIEQQANHGTQMYRAAQVLELFLQEELDTNLFGDVKRKVFEFLPQHQP